MAIVGLVAGAGLAILFALVIGLGTRDSLADALQGQALAMFMLAGGLIGCALLLFPSVFYAWKRINGNPVGQPLALPKILRPSLLILALPVVLLLGYWVSEMPGISWLLLPPLHFLAIGLPVWWLVYLAARNLPLGSLQRRWGVFGSGLVLGPALIMALEFTALIGVGLIGIVFLVNQPGLVEQLSSLAQSLQAGTATQEELVQAILPWLARPSVILAVIAFASVIVPLIEEAVKPIGVWLLAGFSLSPAAGFAAGAISGAGYAFFESLALAGSGADWAVSVLTRVPTGVIHILNTALMGWALTLAWREKRYFNLGLTYLIVVTLHGMWNGLAIISAVDALLAQQGLQSPLGAARWIGPAAPFLLVGITLSMFAVIIWMNRRLRQASLMEQNAPEAVLVTTAVEIGQSGDVL